MPTTQTLSELINTVLINPDADCAVMDEDARELLAGLFAGVANGNRIGVLKGVEQGRSMKTVADEDVGISEQAVRSHAERLVEADLVYRTEGADQLYQITPFGRFLLQFIDEHADGIVAAYGAVDDAEDEVRSRFDGMNLAEDEMSRQVDRLKWDVAEDQIEDELDL